MTSSLLILGCSGGISKDLRTTSFLLNETILIDAGTGVGDLTLDQLKKIDYLFLTHSHLDHICRLPFILDAVGMSRDKPLTVFGIPETIKALQDHIFNNVIWPDFTKIPSPENPCVVFKTIAVGQTVSVDQVEITALPVNHSIPGNGYWIDSGEGALVFSGDTGPCTAFWNAINEKVNERSADKGNDYLKHLIIETSFTNAESELAKISGHYHPELLASDLQKLSSACNVWITHLKPDESAKIMQEISHHLDGKYIAKSLKNGQLLPF
jgi:cAMP phosphodiesterase